MTKRLVIFAACLALTCSALSTAQMKFVRKGESGKQGQLPDDMFDLRELASLVVFRDGKLVVDNVFDKQMRPKEYAGVDIREGDIILMMNGKRMKSLEDLKDAYDSVASGSPVKFGIERGTDMVMVSFDKADPEKLPNRRMVIRRGDERDGEGHDVMIIPGTGLLVGAQGKEVTVEDILSDGSSSLKDADVQKGDVITAINDTKVRSFKDFDEAYKKIDVGSTATLHTSRKNKQLSFSFTKAQGGQQRIIKREKD